jgi:hypothetical protein
MENCFKIRSILRSHLKTTILFITVLFFVAALHRNAHAADRWDGEPPIIDINGPYGVFFEDRQGGDLPYVSLELCRDGSKLTGSWGDDADDSGGAKGHVHMDGDTSATFGLTLYVFTGDIFNPKSRPSCRLILTGVWSNPTPVLSFPTENELPRMTGFYHWAGCHPGDGGTFKAAFGG